MIKLEKFANSFKLGGISNEIQEKLTTSKVLVMGMAGGVCQSGDFLRDPAGGVPACVSVDPSAASVPDDSRAVAVVRSLRDLLQ